jgi:hypothetical protein
MLADLRQRGGLEVDLGKVCEASEDAREDREYEMLRDCCWKNVTVSILEMALSCLDTTKLG